MTNYPFLPLYNKDSKILILGSFPSVKSREQKFFYGHPQNRFWKVISFVFECDEPKNIEEKKQLLLENGIALWDVIASCEIIGSADSTIKNVKVNDISRILKETNINKVFVNGKTAEKYFKRYTKNQINIDASYLPSTSPANAAWTLERLVDEWKVIKGI